MDFRDPYEICPTFETEHLQFWQVREDDAEGLLCFYGDLSRWMFYGNEMSNSIFSSQHATITEMKKCIRVWLDEYKNKYYIRLTAIDKKTAKPIGSVELFDNAGDGFLAVHIDFSEKYEKSEYIGELLCLADERFYELFGLKHIIIRATPAEKERVSALTANGYTPLDGDSGWKDYYIK